MNLPSLGSIIIAVAVVVYAAADTGTTTGVTRHQWSFRRTETMETLASQAEIGVRVSKHRGHFWPGVSSP